MIAEPKRENHQNDNDRDKRRRRSGFNRAADAADRDRAKTQWESGRAVPSSSLTNWLGQGCRARQKFRSCASTKTISGAKATTHRSIFPNPMSRGSSTITEFGNTLLLGAMITTEESPILLKAVADNSDTTCRTNGCERMDRAFEAIVGMSLSVFGDLECFVVIVSAGLTFGHSVTARGFSRSHD
jgi:hypothetical protein